jgi:flagellar hook protein FlgE
MAITGSIFTGMSGLITYSRGLDVISNNVANLNTPGFKGSDLQFRDLFYDFQWVATQGGQLANEQDGSGVGDGGTSIRFRPGDLQETGNDTDAAIEGNGFFVLRGKDGTVYTRAGQFQFDDDGFLVSANGEERVAGFDENGQLVDVTLEGLRTIAPQATSEVIFFDNLSSGSNRHVINDLEIIDRNGETQTWTVTFTNNQAETPRSWLIEVEDEDGNILTVGQEIRFQGNGSPEEGFNRITFTVTPEDGEAFDVSFFFGEPNSFTKATSFSGGATSSLAVESQDGFRSGSLVSVGFTREGRLDLEYSNGESQQSTRLALAWFQDLQELRQLEGARFIPRGGQEAEIGGAAEGVFGEIVEETLEISNIELTSEFTDLIIVQRGFQASSQVITVANEMLQQLLSMGRGR